MGEVCHPFSQRNTIKWHHLNLHGHVINEACPSDGMLQKDIDPFLERLSPLLHVTVVKKIFRLVVLVDGEKDGIELLFGGVLLLLLVVGGGGRVHVDSQVFGLASLRRGGSGVRAAEERFREGGG